MLTTSHKGKEGTFPKIKGISSMTIRLKNSSLVGMDAPKPSAKNFEIQNGTRVDKHHILFQVKERNKAQ